MSNLSVIHIKPAMRLRPMSPFLDMLVEHAHAKLTRPEGMVPSIRIDAPKDAGAQGAAALVAPAAVATDAAPLRKASTADAGEGGGASGTLTTGELGAAARPGDRIPAPVTGAPGEARATPPADTAQAPVPPAPAETAFRRLDIAV